MEGRAVAPSAVHVHCWLRRTAENRGRGCRSPPRHQMPLGVFTRTLRRRRGVDSGGGGGGGGGGGVEVAMVAVAVAAATTTTATHFVEVSQWCTFMVKLWERTSRGLRGFFFIAWMFSREPLYVASLSNAGWMPISPLPPPRRFRTKADSCR